MSVDGFLVIDKDADMTSHDVVAIARRALGTKKVGHAGTLDPMATGVLVLGFGIGTRLLQYVTDGLKRYEATIVLGISTVSDDSQGEVIAFAEPKLLARITTDEIERALSKMRGVIFQRPSSVSAVKVAGKRAYDRVRAGENVELAAREVRIDQLEVKEIRRDSEKIEIGIDVVCGSGTFIRAIARDCGDELRVGGHLNSLRRTLVAPFDLSRAISIAALKSGDFESMTVEEVAKLRFPLRDLSAEEAREIGFGRSLPLGESTEITAALQVGQLVALLENREGRAHPIAVFERDASRA